MKLILVTPEEAGVYREKAKTFNHTMFADVLGVCRMAIAEYLANQDGKTFYDFLT